MKRAEQFAQALLAEDVQRVIVRRFPKGNNKGDLIAIFPDAETSRGGVLTYMHVGQHSEASRWSIIEATVPAGEGEDVDKLLAELCALGYELRVVKRMPAWSDGRKRG